MTNTAAKACSANCGTSTQSRDRRSASFLESGYFVVPNIGQMTRELQCEIYRCDRGILFCSSFCPERYLLIHPSAVCLDAYTQLGISFRRWFTEARIPYEFRPRHALLTMHVWFLHKRLLADRVDSHLALLVQVRRFSCLSFHPFPSLHARNTQS